MKGPYLHGGLGFVPENRCERRRSRLGQCYFIKACKVGIPDLLMPARGPLRKLPDSRVTSLLRVKRLLKVA